MGSLPKSSANFLSSRFPHSLHLARPSPLDRGLPQLLQSVAMTPRWGSLIESWKTTHNPCFAAGDCHGGVRDQEHGPNDDRKRCLSLQAHCRRVIGDDVSATKTLPRIARGAIHLRNLNAKQQLPERFTLRLNRGKSSENRICLPATLHATLARRSALVLPRFLP